MLGKKVYEVADLAALPKRTRKVIRNERTGWVVYRVGHVFVLVTLLPLLGVIAWHHAWLVLAGFLLMAGLLVYNLRWFSEQIRALDAELERLPPE